MSTPPTDHELTALARLALAALAHCSWRVALAESCTGGWIAKTLTDLPGSSRQFEAGFVTYANSIKESALGVRAETLARVGAVSREVVLEMASGARERSGAQLAIAVSGVAGPDGGTAAKPVGLVWFGAESVTGEPQASSCQFAGDREEVRRQAVAQALKLIAELARARGTAAP